MLSSRELTYQHSISYIAVQLFFVHLNRNLEKLIPKNCVRNLLTDAISDKCTNFLR